MKTKHYILGALLFLFLSCSNSGKKSDEEMIETDSLSVQEQVESSKTENEEHIFRIEAFVHKADSLLKKFKGSRYHFELQTDTIDLTFRDKTSQGFKYGMFKQLLNDSLTSVVRHYIFEPKTSTILRFYLIEATFTSKESLEKKMSELFVAMNHNEKIEIIYDFEQSGDSIIAGIEYWDDSTVFSCDYSPLIMRYGLTGCNDYIATADNKLYWLNGSLAYTRKQFDQFIACFNSFIDTTFKERIVFYIDGESRCIKKEGGR